MGKKARPRPKHLAAKLRAIREHLELSQAQLADRLDFKVSYGRISEYEHGTREPNLLVLLSYSNIASVPMEMLINDRVSLTRFRDALRKNDNI